MLNDNEKTKRLVIDVKTRNGRRKSMDFHITEIEATDPLMRAAAVHKYSACATDSLNGTTVNWRIED